MVRAPAADTSGGAVDPDLYADAALREGFRPAYPPELVKAGIGGDVRVRLNVDATGKLTAVRVVESPDPRLAALAEAAVKAWTFVPGLDKGLPVACGLEVDFSFDPHERRRGDRAFVPESEQPHGAPKTPAQPKATPPGRYPAVLTERFVPGLVQFSCQVGPDGRTLSAKVRETSHADFVQPALATLAEWEFTPAMQGDQPVAAELTGEMTFDQTGPSEAEVLTVNGITAPDGTVPAVAPKVLFMADPVWPFEALLGGRDGDATVSFTVSENGLVKDVKVEAASAPEFGAALAAAVETWIFSRTFDSGKAVTVALRKHAEFKPAAADDPVARLAAALRAGHVGGAKGLDARLAPAFQMPPLYPAALKAAGGPAGQAEIEFVIDRDGRARLPRVVSASREEFGWAAATAVAQWVFFPPRRGGQPVDVKVRVPFDFSAPME